MITILLIIEGLDLRTSVRLVVLIAYSLRGLNGYCRDIDPQGASLLLGACGNRVVMIYEEMAEARISEPG